MSTLMPPSPTSKAMTQPHDAGSDDILLTRVDRIVALVRKFGVNWFRKNSVWPLPFATACCGIEVMATGASKFDLARFGMERMAFSPRQADLLIVAGRVGIKMMPVLQRVYLQMSEPKWVISMGACASTGGVFDTYATIQGIDQFLPVDVYVPGCPPRPEQLLEGVMAIQRIIDRDGVPGEYRKPLGLVMNPVMQVRIDPTLMQSQAAALPAAAGASPSSAAVAATQA